MRMSPMLLCVLLGCVLLSFSASGVFAESHRADETYAISGTVYLEGQTDHSGTTVSIEATIVPSLGMWGMVTVLMLVTLVLMGRKQVKPALVLLFIGVGVFSLSGLVSGDLMVVTGPDGGYVLTNPDGEEFIPRTYVVRLDHVGYQSQQVQFVLPANASHTFGLSDVTLVPIGGLSAGDLYATDSIVGNLRYVPATGPGGFVQGSPTDEPCRRVNEPQFTHVLTRNIAVMETEISRQMWADLQAVQPTMPNDPTDTSYGGGMTNPAQNITWFEVVLFANLLSVQQGLTRCYYMDAAFTDPVTSSNYTTTVTIYCNFDASGYRLLTEGEWEYAARAGTTTPFSCTETNYTTGNCESCKTGTHPTLEQYTVYCATRSGESSAPVGSKLANPWNLKDMHGNVYECCWDWYNYYPGDITDYAGFGSGTYRVVRSGGWGGNVVYCRSALRYVTAPGLRYYFIGFRLARSVNQECGEWR